MSEEQPLQEPERLCVEATDQGIVVRDEGGVLVKLTPEAAKHFAEAMTRAAELSSSIGEFNQAVRFCHVEGAGFAAKRRQRSRKSTPGKETPPAPKGWAG